MNQSVSSTRPQLLLNVLPAGALGCLGCTKAGAVCLAQSAQTQPPKHKFTDKSDMTYEQIFGFAFQDGTRFIPIMKILAEEIGKTKFLEMVKRASSKSAAEGALREYRTAPRRDLAAWIAPFKSKDPFWEHVVTYRIVEETERAVELKITECLWAKTCRQMDAADIGYAAICHGDFASAPVFNPKMRMVRTKTLMQGDDFCNHRWTLEG